MNPKDVLNCVNAGLSNAWLITSVVLYSTHHWIGGTVALGLAIVMMSK
jgi:hypothetical protein